jgi:hypothetical protein
MRQPDNLPAVCRVHRNGRPITSISNMTERQQPPIGQICARGGCGVTANRRVGARVSPQSAAGPITEVIVGPGAKVAHDRSTGAGPRRSSDAGAPAGSFMRRRHSSDANRDTCGRGLGRLPQRLDRITRSLEQGNLSGHVRLFADQRDTGFVRSLVNRAVMAFLGATPGIMSVILLGIRGGPALLPAAAAGHGTGVFQAFGYLGLFLSIILILRVIIATAREGIG